MTHRPSPLEQDPAQDGLFEVEVSRLAPARILDIPDPNAPADDTPEHYAVADIRDAAPHVLSALGHLAQASSRKGFEKVAYTDEASEVKSRHERQGKDFEGYQQGARFTLRQEMGRARNDFLKAYNIGLETPVTTDDQDFRLAFNSFAQRYGVSESAEWAARKSAHRTKAVKGLTTLQKTLTGLPEAEPKIETFELSKEAKLRIKHRESRITRNLEILRDHPDAGFLPSSYQEGTAARQILRKMADGLHGAQNLVTDVGTRLGAEAMARKIKEYADFMNAGMQSWEALAALNELLDQDKLSPNTLLTTLGGKDNAAYAPLVRFMDIESRSLDPLHGQNFDPQRNRRTDFVSYDGTSTKQLHGMYESESPEDLEFVEQRVALLLGKMNVAEARTVVARALQNEDRRAMFWVNTLSSLQGAPGRIARGELEAAGVKVQ